MRKATAVVLSTVVLASGIAACGWSPKIVGPQRDPRWTVQLPTGSGEAVRATIAGDIVLVEAAQAVVALAAGDGHLLWHVDLPTLTVSSEKVPKVRLAGQTVVISDWDHTWLYDLATGRLKATVQNVPASVSRSQVYFPGWGAQAYDTATGQKRWQSPETGRPGVGARVDSSADPADRHLLVVGDAERVVVTPTEPGARLSVLDARTGREIGTLPGLKPNEGQVFVSDHTVLRWDTHDASCHHDLTAYETVGGAQKWATTVVQWRQGSGDGPLCDGTWTPLLAGKRLLMVTAQDAPQILDVESGTAVWTGTPGSIPLVVNEDTVLTRKDHGRGTYVAVDLASNRALWSQEPSRGAPTGIGDPTSIIPVKDGFVLTVFHSYQPSFKATSYEFVHVFGARDGQIRWHSPQYHFALMASATAVVTRTWLESSAVGYFAM